jgi:hypothetical protein
MWLVFVVEIEWLVYMTVEVNRQPRGSKKGADTRLSDFGRDILEASEKNCGSGFSRDGLSWCFWDIAPEAAPTARFAAAGISRLKSLLQQVPTGFLGKH